MRSLRVAAEIAPFFSDLPARMAASHLVIVAFRRLDRRRTRCDRPAVDPGAAAARLDQDQFANAGVLESAGGALRLARTHFTPQRLAAEIAELAAAPQRLAAMAAAAQSVGRLDAADRLADLVLKVAGRDAKQ